MNILGSPSSSESRSSGLDEKAFLALRSLKPKEIRESSKSGTALFAQIEKLDLQKPHVLLHKITPFARISSNNNKTNFAY